MPATLAAAAGRRQDRVRRAARPLRALGAAGRRVRRRRARRRRAATTAVARSGELAGLRAAHELGFGDAATHAARLQVLETRARRRRRATGRGRAGGRRRRPRQVLRLLLRGRDQQGHRLSIDEGYDSIELSKRYTTVTMGPCQGRMCQLPSVRLMAQHNGSRSATSASPPPARRGCRCRWGSSAAGRSSRPSARRSTAATARSARTSSGPATGAAPTTTATRRRGAGRQPRGRADRRLDARQAARPRRRRRRVPRPPVPEPLLRPEARAHPLRRDQLRRRPDHRRRHDLPARRRDLLRDDHLQRRRRGRGVVLVVAGRLGLDVAADRPDPGARGGQPRGPAGAGDHLGGVRRRLLQRGVQLPRRPHGDDRRRPLPGPADRLRRRGRLRDPLSRRRTASTSGTR